MAEISQAHLPACACEDDEIEDNEDTDLSITECAVLPDAALLCKRCAKARPDVALAYKC